MIELFVSAFFLGLLFNAMPGTVFAESLRRGLTGGYPAAFAVQVGSLAGDFTWAVLGLLGAAALFTLPYIDLPMAIAGGFLLTWMAWQAFRDGMSPVPAFDPDADPMANRSALLAGVGLSLSNPMNMTYWAGLGGTITALGVSEPGWAAFLIFLAGFMASSFIWCFICAGMIGWTRHYIGLLAWRLINFGCGLGIAYFAILIFWRVLAPLFSL